MGLPVRAFIKYDLIPCDTIILESLFLSGFRPASIYFLDGDFSGGKAEVFRPLAAVLINLEQTPTISLGYVATVCPKTGNATGTRVSMIRVCVYISLSFSVF